MDTAASVPNSDKDSGILFHFPSTFLFQPKLKLNQEGGSTDIPDAATESSTTDTFLFFATHKVTLELPVAKYRERPKLAQEMPLCLRWPAQVDG